MDTLQERIQKTNNTNLALEKRLLGNNKPNVLNSCNVEQHEQVSIVNDLKKTANILQNNVTNVNNINETLAERISTNNNNIDQREQKISKPVEQELREAIASLQKAVADINTNGTSSSSSSSVVANITWRQW